MESFEILMSRIPREMYTLHKTGFTICVDTELFNMLLRESFIARRKYDMINQGNNEYESLTLSRETEIMIKSVPIKVLEIKKKGDMWIKV